jgi:ABC-type uncharacterized transport system substrate-binding protein
LLAGAEPATVPVEDPNRFRLLLNAGAAERLDLAFASDLVREADEVIG